MNVHVRNRRQIVEELRKELVGPAPSGKPIEASHALHFTKREEFDGPYHQADSGEEILIRESPTQRYGVGVLFPQRLESTAEDEVLESASSPGVNDGLEIGRGELGRPFEPFQQGNHDDAAVEMDLSSANSLKPSTMAVSFLAELHAGGALEIAATGGRYHSREAMLAEDNRKPYPAFWWLREPVTFTASISTEFLVGAGPKRLSVVPTSSGNGVQTHSENITGLDLELQVLSRPTAVADQRLLTVCLVNRSRTYSSKDTSALALYQSHFRVGVQNPSGVMGVLPYPFPTARHDPEQLAQDMLYRNTSVFATGHGCAADWESKLGALRASSVSAVCLPQVELPTVTPDIKDGNGDLLVISMKHLSSLQVGSELWKQLEQLISLYEEWIGSRSEERLGSDFPTQFHSTADLHLEECMRAANRMRSGMAYLQSDSTALRAFQLANEAIHLQQIATRSGSRKVSFDVKDSTFRVEGEYVSPEERALPEGRGYWRAFQIGFLLSSIESTGNFSSADRGVVDLIWFPTGGGKTEAYLGLAAFSMFKRRLDNPGDAGVSVITRYTLRLLTTQQFERTSGLICAMDRIRSRDPEALGDVPFSIGIWVGGETTPNNCAVAVRELAEYRKSPRAENPFLINKCPWCGASLGRVEVKKGKKRTFETPGYRKDDFDLGLATVVLHCPDPKCPFSPRLPIYVVDEDIYQVRPSVVIGTVDKFANLAWVDNARALFGLDQNGDRAFSPPGLIIQDELHLITGPLGSLAGLFEAVVAELCTDSRGATHVLPKIVASTATTRRYKSQVKGLYDRENVCLFPPPGLEAGDSFFAKYDDTGRPGRIYVGVHAPGFGSYQTEWVRTLSALFQAPLALADGQRDPWWTLLLFCNSIRDMGTAHTLFDSDVRDYSQAIWKRYGVPKDYRRYFAKPPQELTGGLKRSEIRKAMDELEVEVGSRPGPIDVCLATNIIEVGVDIQRLSLMVVAGQPKTTAQYIQATGRVGRDPNKPGLVVTMYGPSKPRDRSHFERFRGYHERLYAQVEPSSVTPFSPPALDRALHAALVAFVRQTGDSRVRSSPYPMPEQEIEAAATLLRQRVQSVDREELSNFEVVLGDRVDEWKRWKRSVWDGRQGEDIPLLRRAGAYATSEEQDLSWATMSSMRNVDAECHGYITTKYLNEELSLGGESHD